VFLSEPNCLSSIFSLIESINQSATNLSQIFESVGVSDIERKLVLISTGLPRPQALIQFHASHYMKGLHEVVRHIVGAQRGVGYERSG
jgi:hypothetical protein